MLALTRKPGQKIVITTPSGERIDVTFERIEGERVRLLFDANREVTIDRLEIFEAKYGA